MLGSDLCLWFCVRFLNTFIYGGYFSTAGVVQQCVVFARVCFIRGAGCHPACPRREAKRKRKVFSGMFCSPCGCVNADGSHSNIGVTQRSWTLLLCHTDSDFILVFETWGHQQEERYTALGLKLDFKSTRKTCSLDWNWTFKSQTNTPRWCDGKCLDSCRPVRLEQDKVFHAGWIWTRCQCQQI